jgi:hypothetical protein
MDAPPLVVHADLADVPPLGERLCLDIDPRSVLVLD